MLDSNKIDVGIQWPSLLYVYKRQNGANVFYVCESLDIMSQMVAKEVYTTTYMENIPKSQ
jgi:hypothetical protein